MAHDPCSMLNAAMHARYDARIHALYHMLNITEEKRRIKRRICHKIQPLKLCVRSEKDPYF